MTAAVAVGEAEALGLFDGPWHRIAYMSPSLSLEVGGDFRGCPAAEVLVDAALGPLLRAMGQVYDTQAAVQIRLGDGDVIRVSPRIADGRLLGVETRWSAGRGSIGLRRCVPSTRATVGTGGPGY